MSDITKLKDEEIVEIVRSDNKEAYAEIIKRYQAKLMRYAVSIIGDDQKGADAVQEGFIKAYINLRGFDCKKKFSSWIYRIVHNEVLNIVKRNKKHQPLFEETDFDSGINLEDEFIKNELIHKTHNCLKRMPLIYREPLTLYYLEHTSYEGISDILRIPIGTVGTRITRAKGVMKKICQKNMI